MRRPTAAVTGMILGTALLAGAKLGTRIPADLGTVVAGPPLEPASGGDASATPKPSSTAIPSQSGPTPGQPAATRTGPTATPSKARTATTAPPAGGGGLRSGTHSGVPVTHKYGTLRLTITVSGGKMTDIKAAYSTSSPVSTNINNDALPELRREALQAQSARIATVSGATYTSDAYRTSLQSALDKAGG